MLERGFFALTISNWDILKTDHWKNVSYHISSLISNFFILNGEILTEPIQDFLTALFLKWFLMLRFWDSRLPTFSISPMPGVNLVLNIDFALIESKVLRYKSQELKAKNKIHLVSTFSHLWWLSCDVTTRNNTINLYHV